MTVVRLVLLCWLGITGCVSLPEQAARLPDAAALIELVETPFYPQEKYQCGPAALNTVLVASGADSTVDSLVDLVYLPARQGSLQAEMLAGTRGKDRIPYLIDPSIAAIYDEIAAGRPVLVLQNLSIQKLPRWHYAVVIGINPRAKRVYLRSGTDERRTMKLKTFLRTWQRSEFWGFVALRPGELPARPDANRYARAVTAMESVGRQAVANAGWRAALQRWPENSLVVFGVAGIEYADGNYERAIKHYRQIIRAEPQHLFARNNLAMALAQRGRLSEASTVISAALQDAAESSAIRRLLSQTADEIKQLQAVATDSDQRE